MFDEIHSNGLNFTLSLRAYEGLSSMLLRPFLGREFMFEDVYYAQLLLGFYLCMLQKGRE